MKIALLNRLFLIFIADKTELLIQSQRRRITKSGKIWNGFGLIEDRRSSRRKRFELQLVGKCFV